MAVLLCNLLSNLNVGVALRSPLHPPCPSYAVQIIRWQGIPKLHDTLIIRAGDFYYARPCLAGLSFIQT